MAEDDDNPKDEGALDSSDDMDDLDDAVSIYMFTLLN